MNLLETNLLNSSQKEELSLYIEASKYYYTDEPLMPDEAFNELEAKLLSYGIGPLTKLITESIFHKSTDSLSNVNEMVSTSDGKHMLISIEKYKYSSYSELKSKIIEFTSNYPNEQIYYGPKLDGGALKIIWDFSMDIPLLKLIQTRGGLDVTEIFNKIPSIQNSYKFGKEIIAGELLVKKKTFYESYLSEEYENPRSFIGSLMKKLTADIEVIKMLDFIPCTDGTNPLLDNPYGLWSKFDNNIMLKIESIYNYMKSDNFPFIVDGIVLAVNEKGERKVKNNYPLNLLALKFKSIKVQAKVIDFEWIQKKTGKLTPKLVLEPVRLDGITATRASIYNYRYLKESRVGIGSIIEITKTNDILPTYVRTIQSIGEIKYPTVPYEKKDINLYAINQEESKIFKFASAIKYLNIAGIGEGTAKEFGFVVDYDIIELFNPAFKPSICEVLKGGASWQRMLEFYNIKTLYLNDLIYILQFNNVGDTIAMKLAMLLSGKSHDTSNIPSEILQTVPRGEGYKKIVGAINKLKQYGVSVINPIEISDEYITFEMTGNPPNMTKLEFVKKLAQLYPKSLHKSLTKETKILFTDDISKNSSKMNKARKYNVKIVTYIDGLNSKI